MKQAVGAERGQSVVRGIQRQPRGLTPVKSSPSLLTCQRAAQRAQSEEAVVSHTVRARVCVSTTLSRPHYPEPSRVIVCTARSGSLDLRTYEPQYEQL